MVLGVVALVGLFFWRLWAPNPQDRVAFPLGDFGEQYFPLRHFVATSFAEGRLPFWNPHIFGGQPGLADPQAAALYPPAALNALLWGTAYPLGALQAEAVAHIAWAALGAYAFARAAQRVGRVPALVAACSFAFGGYLTGFPLQQVTILETLAWLPWWLLGLHGASPGATRAPWLAAAGAGVALALALLAGHPQSALYLAYLGGAYTGFRLLQVRPRPVVWLRAAGPLALPFVLGVGLAAAQLLPTARFIAESSRAQPAYEFVRGGQVWLELLETLLPKVNGGTPLYAGVIPLLLAPLALRGGGAERRFWVGAALVSLLLSLGGNSAFFDWLYLGLPGLASVRSQERVLIVWAWSVALLAAWGTAWLGEAPAAPAARATLRRYAGWLGRCVPGLFTLLLGFWWLRALEFAQFEISLEVFSAFWERYTLLCLLFGLFWLLLAWQAREPRRWLPGLLVALLLFDLFTVNRAHHWGPPRAQALSPSNEIVAALGARPLAEQSRVGIVGNPTPRGNDGMRWGLALLSGNEPLRLAATEAFLAHAPAWRQLQLLAAPWVVADQDLAALDPAAYELVARSADPTSFLLRVRAAMPYAWLVGEAEAVSGDQALWARLSPPEFDPYRVALVEGSAPALDSQAGSGTVEVVAREPGGVTVKVENPGSGPLLLLLAEPATEGWRVTLDGTPVPWLRANGLNIATEVPPGNHEVTLYYEPPGWRTGMAVSGASGLALLGVAGAGLRQRRQVRRKVAAWVLRRGADDRPQLLVHRFVDEPMLPLRLPGGGLEPRETPEAALHRELAEESGLTGMVVERTLGVQRYWKPFLQAHVERHDFLLRAPADLPDSWEQVVTGKGEDASARFLFHWLTSADLDVLDTEFQERARAVFGAQTATT